MDVKLQVQAEQGKLLEMRKSSDGWSVWDGEQMVVSNVLVDDRKLSLDHYKLLVKEDGVTARIIRFADIHRHSDNSLKDGMTTVPELVENTEWAGGLTDHGNMYGFLEFYKGMKGAGKHPIIGFEAYQENMDGELKGDHLILLAKNTVGYQNLLKLTSESFDHFYRVPHVTWDMLRQYKEGVICSSACLGGVIPEAIKAGDMEKARAAVRKFLSIYGEDFYLEIQRHGIEEELVVNPALISLSKEFHVPLIATTDSHYLRRDDAKAHEVLLCLQYQKTLSEPHATFSGTGYHVHTSEEMEELFRDLPDALDNTLLLAEKCNVEIPLGDVNLPDYEMPEGFSTPLEYFEHLCDEGFKRRFAGTPHETDPVYLKRFEYELETIKSMHFESYFIIVQDFINYAREIGVYVGPGRGSAAGSLLAYCMGITDMDPIRFNLLFERFLNPERVSWPDIDTDIEHVGRQKVIDYITHKYGAESVCRIVTFGTMAAKMSLKDVARVMGYPTSWSNELAKLVPSGPKMTLAAAFKMNPELQNRYETDAEAKAVIDIARKLEGNKRHASQHACGLVVSPGAVSDFLPTAMVADEVTKEKSLTSQVVMTEVEELSLLKMDLLGLKNLTAIHEVIDTVKRTRGVDTVYQALPLTDRETYQMLAKGITGGVFQLESPGMTSVVQQMLTDIDTLPEERMDECFERLIAAVALYRPGPMDFIPNYISGMNDVEHISYLDPQLEEILRPTYSVIVFQEQVMQIVQKLAGYTLGRADVVRKAMGKKKTAVMDAEKVVFIHGNREVYQSGKDAAYAPGCVANGIPEAVAEQIWSQMADFAKYAFNRSHAACYAWLAFITAYMSCHWAPEFYCAMMNAFEDVSDKVKVYLALASKRGIKILPPDINKSMDKCTVENGCIRIGLRSLMGLNKTSHAIVNVRNMHGNFEDYQDLVESMNDAGFRLDKSAHEALIFSGALDSWGLNRQQLHVFFPALEDNYKQDAENRQLGQFSLFSAEQTKLLPPECPEYAESYLMEKEYGAIGFYLTKHPVDEVYEIADRAKDSYMTVTDLAQQERDIGSTVTYGLISGLKQLFTRNGDEMYMFSIEDRYRSIRCVMFPRRVPSNKHRLMNGNVVKVIGEHVIDSDRGPQIIVSDLVGHSELYSEQKRDYVTITIRNKDEQDLLLEYLQQHPGDTEVRLYALGKTFTLKQGLAMSPEKLLWLKSNFSQVSGNNI